MLARETVGQRRDAERAGMRRHVPAVGDHRHRAEQRTADDLGHHGRGGQRHHKPGAELMPVVTGAKKDMAVLPRLDWNGYASGTCLLRAGWLSKTRTA